MAIASPIVVVPPTPDGPGLFRTAIAFSFAAKGSADSTITLSPGVKDIVSCLVECTGANDVFARCVNTRDSVSGLYSIGTAGTLGLTMNATVAADAVATILAKAVA